MGWPKHPIVGRRFRAGRISKERLPDLLGEIHVCGGYPSLERLELTNIKRTLLVLIDSGRFKAYRMGGKSAIQDATA